MGLIRQTPTRSEKEEDDRAAAACERVESLESDLEFPVKVAEALLSCEKLLSHWCLTHGTKSRIDDLMEAGKFNKKRFNAVSRFPCEGSIRRTNYITGMENMIREESNR